MSELYKVTFNINATYGYVAYDDTKHIIEVSFPDTVVADKIKMFLATEQQINMPSANNVSEFSSKSYLAANSMQDFQTVLTRLWENLGVHVDWSFPSELI